MNHNPHNLKVGDTVILDKGYDNECEVEILYMTHRKLYSTIKGKLVYTHQTWEVLTSRLSPKEK